MFVNVFVMQVRYFVYNFIVIIIGSIMHIVMDYSTIITSLCLYCSISDNFESKSIAFASVVVSMYC